MTLAHPLQENRLIAAVMDKVRIHDLRKDAEEIVPYQLLLFCIVGPEAVLDVSFGGLDANPDQVVEIAVGQPFHIQKDGSAYEFWVRNADGVDLVFADCKRPQGMMMFLLLASRFPAAATRTKCVGQLSDREDALAVERLAIFLRYAGQQTEFVLFPSLACCTEF